MQNVRRAAGVIPALSSHVAVCTAKATLLHTHPHAQAEGIRKRPQPGHRFCCNWTAFPAEMHILSTGFHQRNSCSFFTLSVFHRLLASNADFLRLSFPLSKPLGPPYSCEELKTVNRHFCRMYHKGGSQFRAVPTGIFAMRFSVSWLKALRGFALAMRATGGCGMIACAKMPRR